MRAIKILAGVLLLGLAFVAAVRADSLFGHPVRRGDFGIPPANAVPVIIQADAAAREPRLIVPKSFVRSARALPPAPATPPAGRTALPLPLAVGLTLSFAVVGLGLVCGRAMTRTLLLTLALVGVGGASLWAHPQPPPLPPKKQYPEGLPLDGVAVEFVEQGDRIRLILPKPMVADLATKLNAVGW